MNENHDDRLPPDAITFWREDYRLMAFIMCDDHNLSVEADGIDPLTARKLMLSEPKPNPTPVEREVIEFGRKHRECNLRVLAD
jgi:hypothetical protein